MSERLARMGLIVILMLYLLLGVAYSVINPIFESPDEALNYDNIRFFIDERRLPVLEPGEPSKAHHPPLYYVLGALLTFGVPDEHFDAVVERINPFWAYRLRQPGVDNKSLYLHDPTLEGFPYMDVALGVHLVRWLSLIMGAGTVVLIWATTRQLFPNRLELAVGAAALVAFNPMFIFITSSVHDDALANLVSVAILFVTVQILTRPMTTRRAVVLGILIGLGFITKLTCLLVLPTAFLALAWKVFVDWSETGWRRAVGWITIVMAVALLVGGWWFIRNIFLYGEPTSMVRQMNVWGMRENAPNLRAAAGDLDHLHDSFWGVFGYGQIPLPRWVYALARLTGLVALGGLVLFWIRRRAGVVAWERPSVVLLILLSAPLVALGANFARMTMSAAANFGRYLFGSLGALAPMYVLGISEWVSTRQRNKLVLGISLVMLALVIFALVGVLAPAYAPPPRYRSMEEVSPQVPLDVSYPQLARLVGYDTAPHSLFPGEVLLVTLYWEVVEETDQDWIFFLQVFGQEGEKIGERDTHPGLGRYPTSRWRAGEIIVDSVPVPLVEDARAPAGLRLDLGFYSPNGDRLTTADGRDTVSVGPVRLAAREPTVPIGTPLSYLLGGGIRLVAWDLNWSEPVSPGEKLQFVLYWSCEAAPGEDLNVFVHLVADGEAQPLAQDDGSPLNGYYPTCLWVTGDVVADPREIPLPRDLPEGNYELLVGLYSLQTMERLPAFDAQGTRLPAGCIPLGSVEVRR